MNRWLMWHSGTSLHDQVSEVQLLSEPSKAHQMQLFSPKCSMGYQESGCNTTHSSHITYSTKLEACNFSPELTVLKAVLYANTRQEQQHIA